MLPIGAGVNVGGPVGAGINVGGPVTRTKAPSIYDQLYKTGYNYADYGMPQDTWMSFGGQSYTKPIAAGAGAAKSKIQDLMNQLNTWAGGGGGGGGYAPTPFNMPSWEPPQVPMLSLDEMMDIINRRVGLMINPQVEGLRRGIEEERGAHERRVGETKEGYEEARGQLQKMGEQQQREGASSMRKRGLYDSGLAMDLANRIQRQVGEHGLKLENEQARVLADLAEYLSTRERHTEEQIQGLEERRGEWSQSLLEEMERQERDRRDRLEQQAFENWLSQTAMEQQIWQANQAAQAAASRASMATPKTAGFNDILQQMQLQALLTMPQRQREEYVLGTLPGTVDDFWEQLRRSQWGTLTPEKQREYLYGLGTISGLY